MRRLHKTALPLVGTVTLNLRPDAKVLAFAEQNGSLCMWYEQDETGVTQRLFTVYGTGDAVAENLVHWGSALVDHGQFVFHLYEVPRARKGTIR